MGVGLCWCGGIVNTKKLVRMSSSSILRIPEHYRKLLAEFSQNESDLLQGIVHLWSLDSAEADQLDAYELDRATLLGCESLMHLIQQGQQVGWTNPAFWIVTRGANSVGTVRNVPGIAQSPLWGLGRVIAEELPQLWGGLIDVDPDYSHYSDCRRPLGRTAKPRFRTAN